MAQDNIPYSFSFAPFTFAPDTTTITDTNTIIGSNIREGDGPIEQHVLEHVGSYGYQLNRIIDVLSVILDHAATTGVLPTSLRPAKVAKDYKPLKDGDARKAVEDFYTLARDTAKESESCKRQAMELATKGLMKRMHRLRKSQNPSDQAIYRSIKAQIETGLLE